MELLPYIQQGTFPVLVAFSGGKDSVALVLYLLEQGISPDRIHLHHHDVDGGGPNLFDWPSTRSYCQAFAQSLGLALYISYRAGGIAREIFRYQEPRQDVYFQEVPGGPFVRIPARASAVNTRGKFPAISADHRVRWCSGTVKIDVLSAVICRHPAYQADLVVLTGERRAESTARQKYKALEPYRAATARRKALHGRPLLNYPDLAVWNMMARHHIQPHPAYMLGWGRCSCQTCIFCSPDLWATLATINPAKVGAIAAIEEKTRFTLYPTGDIWNRVSRGTALQAPDPFWITQALGDFTAPIRVDTWTLPPGAFARQTAGAG